MILLLGGTSETASVATALAASGYQVLVSTATDISLDVGNHANIHRRAGRLNEETMIALVREQEVEAIVDATHPYATAVRNTAKQVADRMEIPYFTFLRPPSDLECDQVLFAADHEEAARIAFSFGRPVLLTTGSRNLEPYIRESRRVEIPVIARVLSCSESVEACRAAGLDDKLVITGRGPFSVAENCSLIQRFGIGVLVTKDSGAPGSVPEKLEAARLEGCDVVVIRRPREGSSTVNVFDTIAQLVEALLEGRRW